METVILGDQLDPLSMGASREGTTSQERRDKATANVSKPIP